MAQLDNPSHTHLGQAGQVLVILQIMKNKRNGFFIEAGAWNGEDLSNTIFLETQLGWTGLLVEPNKQAFQTLVGKRRNAYSINSCLSPNRYAQQIAFEAADELGTIKEVVAKGSEVEEFW